MKDYILASCNLYGVIKLEDFIKIYEHYEDFFDLNIFLNEIKLLNQEEDFKISFKDNLLSGLFYNLDNEVEYLEALDIINDLADMDYYLPAKLEFLKYQDLSYIEEKESLLDLIKYVKENNIITSNDLDDELEAILSDYLYPDGVVVDFDVYLIGLCDLGFNFSNLLQIEEFKNLLDDSTLDVRLYTLKGNTLSEYYKQNNN